MKRRALGLGAAALALAGCGYIGEPMPPLLNIPVRITDLAAAQQGGRIIVQFSVPRLTTEGVALRNPPRLEVLAGPNINPFHMDTWAASAKPMENGQVQDDRARYEAPVDAWAGKEVVFAARAIGPRGREGSWSNLVTLAVVPPPPQPAGLSAEAVPEGVRLTWQANAARFRVYRRTDDQKAFQAVADTSQPTWTDTATEYGHTYYYEVESLVGEARSIPSWQVRITPVDIFPPAIPAGLTAVASISSIELAWERDSEPDLAGYRVYRAAPGGAFTKLAETGTTPSYSDRGVEHGKAYRYAVTAVDTHGNESKMSAPVEATTP